MLDRLNKGYTNGGLVGGGPASMAVGGAVNATVNVDSNGNASTTAPAGYENFARDIGRYVDARFNELLTRSQRQGGMAWQAKQGAY